MKFAIAFWILVAALIYYSFFGRRREIPAPPKATPRPRPDPQTATVCPKVHEPFREGELPTVPSYLRDPFIFRDRNLGICLLAGWPIKAAQLNETFAGYRAATIETWIFHVHANHWCSVRRATPNDIDAVENAKRYGRALLIMREQ